jgi:hypothetical protein
VMQVSRHDWESRHVGSAGGRIGEVARIGQDTGEDCEVTQQHGLEKERKT